MLTFRLPAAAFALAALAAPLALPAADSPAPALSAPAVAPKTTAVRLLADRTAVAPGAPFRLAVVIDHAEHKHTYWVNPGDSGTPTDITWKVKIKEHDSTLTLTPMTRDFTWT